MRSTTNAIDHSEGKGSWVKIDLAHSNACTGEAHFLVVRHIAECGPTLVPEAVRIRVIFDVV